MPDCRPGYADDAVIAAVALRSVARRAGSEAIVRHWPEGPDGLAAVLRLAGLERRGCSRRRTSRPPATGEATA